MTAMPQSRHQVREATQKDAPGIAAVHARSFLATYPHLPRTRQEAETGLERWTEVWRRRLDRAGLETLVVGNDSVAGFVHFGESPDGNDTGQVLSIHVDPELVGKGIGSLLIGIATDSLRTAGYEEATLWVVGDNHRAREFYEGLGWQADGSQKREVLAVEGGDGDEVEVVRYRIFLGRES